MSLESIFTAQAFIVMVGLGPFLSVRPDCRLVRCSNVPPGPDCTEVFEPLACCPKWKCRWVEEKQQEENEEL